MLVAHVMRVVWGASKAVGIYGLFVEALNEKAKAFYLRLGFIQLVDENSNLLFYPTKSIEQLLLTMSHKETGSAVRLPAVSRLSYSSKYQ